ncbi:MAG: NAD(P)H-dependent oxidoreductase [Firmicutes bacterium]|nr:NAD(P)H-dependent oxidoreductase [Bacillota bacterium]MCL1953996.1 NAD(P)H-dependent oxidoreductase [Bacillota bacterium]
MKNLIIFGHNDLNKSMVSKYWLEHLQAKKDKDTTILCLCEQLKDGNFYTAIQRDILKNHDRILIVFPLYWYSHPSLLQKYLEQVLTGTDNAEFVNELRLNQSKELMIAVSAAAEAKNFGFGGAANLPLDMYLSNWYGFAKYCNMLFKPIYCTYNVYTLSKEQLIAECDKAYNQFLTSKGR